MRKRGIYNVPAKKLQRRRLRNYGTPAEAVLWSYLRNRRLAGMKFRRQYGVGPFILDFYCPECRLAVELDGASHFQPGTNEYEARRSRYLTQCEIRVLRFENRVLFGDPEFVLRTIQDHLTKNTPPGTGGVRPIGGGRDRRWGRGGPA